MPVQLQLTGHAKDLGGGFTVRRFLPSAKRQSVGPFLFFDHFGPVPVKPADNYDVRPHPHIGLATVTYLFDGAITHRDSLGYVQDIEPGAINWMTAGKGIVHSERRPQRLAGSNYVNHGIQLWAALPVGHEEVAPSFEHTPSAAIPSFELHGVSIRVLIGNAFGLSSPVNTFSPTLYLDVNLPAGGSLVLPADLADEVAVYPVDGAVRIDGEEVPANTLAILQAGSATIASTGAARLIILGGATLPERRFMWWNFISSSKERIVQASKDWEAQAFAKVPGETEFIPLPEHKFE
ncbi:MAG: pirin family protein [Comamonadaceae bacterium]|nr:MAG: pirin family protein [Comamonadaceae bacterium]